MHGIDVSNNNSVVDWDGVEFCFIKASEGQTFTDPDFGTFVAACESRGIPWGSYHFAHPDRNSAKAEAAFFLNKIGNAKLPLAPALDFETRQGVNPLAIMGPTAAAAWVDEFLGIVAQTTSRLPFFYTFRDYATHLYPLVDQRWRRWLATAVGHPGSFTTFDGYPIAIEQWGQSNGVDVNESYQPLGEDDVTEDEIIAAVRKALDEAIPQNSSPSGWTGYLSNILGKLDDLEQRVQALQAGGGSNGPGPNATHFVGTVDLHSAP